MNNNVYRIKELIDELNYFTKKYDEGNPIISDKEWDDLYFELSNLEKETGIIYPTSPTQIVHFETVSELSKVIHQEKPMLSLDKTKEVSTLENYLKGHEWCAMFKMDGLSARLTYEDGKLIKAETRGNGIEGEDITHNAFVIPTIPKEIPIKEEIIVDGEIICDRLTFKKYFANDYKNERNFASGSIRLLDSKESAFRYLGFVAWDLIKGCPDIDFFFWRLEKLDDWGFMTVPRVGDAETIQDAIDALNNMAEEHKIYPIDGYVFRFESQKYYDSLGSTDHHFRGAIAYKFYDNEVETELLKIELSMGRTGVLTPVAIFRPIEIEGTTVERASLHNLSVLESTLGSRPELYQKIWVAKMNQIIPQITRAEKCDIEHDHTIFNIYNCVCPVCGGYIKVEISDTGVKNIVCTNSECSGKLLNRIDHFCGKKGLDIKGLSKKTIEKLIEWGWLGEIKDIYNLEKYKNEWKSKSGFGEASVSKILNAINEAGRCTKLDAFISALGIPLVGRTISKEIIKYYPTWEEFRQAVGGDWTEFDGFGYEISKAINNFDYTEADEIVNKYIEFAEDQPEYTIEPAATAIKDKVFCVTGKLKNYSRDSIKSEIESLGGKVSSSITSKVNYLITNTPDSGTQKNKDAQKLNIPIITEDEYIRMKGEE